ncbi:MAG: 50S ribosome-binding GTPase [Hyphomicrobiaceae bacterium]|nr:50S ribosome-binding GTPase [Hyphomicrobiaceae bacterium]
MTVVNVANAGVSMRHTGELPHVPGLSPPVADSGTAMGLLHILTCGSVDDGKSTLIGRLLWDACDLPDDTRASLARSVGADGVPDFSLLVDGLVAEREQGITIDIAWRYVDSVGRRLVIIDSPGHEQYTRNMASGASHADVAIMLVDARHGVKSQTQRHAAILDLVGVRRVILAVNKMDLVGWSEARFREISSAFAELSSRIGFAEAVALPVAARTGDNVAVRSARMGWYSGPTLVELLAGMPGRERSSSQAKAEFRMPVQTVLRSGTDFRGLAGTISSGRIHVGDEIAEALSGRRAHVRRIVTMDGDLDAAASGAAVVVELDRDIDVSRGALLTVPGSGAAVARRLTTRLAWLSDVPFDKARGLLLRFATDLVPVADMTILRRIDLETMAETPANVCGVNDIVVADIQLARSAAVDAFSRDRELGSFVLVDGLSGDTLAGGIVVGYAGAAGNSDDDRLFRLTPAMLANGVCAGVPEGSSEFRRRMQEVAFILGAAGVKVEIADETTQSS